MRQCVLAIIYLAFASFVAMNAMSQTEPTSTEQALAQLRQALDRDENMSPETRKAFAKFAAAMQAELAHERESGAAPQTWAAQGGETIARVVDRRVEERLARIEYPPWNDTLKRLSMSGDLRLRHESSFDLDGKDDRHRERLRFRLRLLYQLSDELLLGGGLRTGDADDPNSAFITLGDGFDDFDVSLDRAFVTYRPQWMDGLKLTAGKFPSPVYRNPVYGELVWDADVHPEGAVAGFSIKPDDALEQFDLLAGAYTVIEDAASDDVWLLSAQATARLRLREGLWMDLSLGYDYYVDPSAARIPDNAGNAVTEGAFVSDFGIVHPIIALTVDGWNHPLTLAAELFHNHRANVSEDTGYAIGVGWGSTKKQGDWRIYYQWQIVEQDAVFSAFAQDDFLLQANFRGHVFGCHTMLDDQIDLHIWGLVTTRDKTSPGQTTASDQDQWRLRADITISF